MCPFVRVREYWGVLVPAAATAKRELSLSYILIGISTICHRFRRQNPDPGALF